MNIPPDSMSGSARNLGEVRFRIYWPRVVGNEKAAARRVNWRARCSSLIDVQRAAKAGRAKDNAGVWERAESEASLARPVVYNGNIVPLSNLCQVGGDGGHMLEQPKVRHWLQGRAAPPPKLPGAARAAPPSSSLRRSLVHVAEDDHELIVTRVCTCSSDDDRLA